jgi:hypothetical protein
MMPMTPLDLQTKANPRSICVFPAFVRKSHNPFDNPNDINNDADRRMAIVFGTDRGSLHYRVYDVQFHPADLNVRALPSMTTTATTIASTTTTKTTTQATSMMLMPLGRQSSPSNIPRHHFPMDLSNLPGPILSIQPLHKKIKSSSSSNNPFQLTFLLIIDDGRGGDNNNNQAGSLASLIVTSNLSSPGFQILSQQKHQQILRLACADVTANGTIVYGLGNRIYVQDNTATSTTTTSSITGPGSALSSHSKRARKFPGELPQSIARGGPLCVLGNGVVAVVYVPVGNAFYGVPAANHYPEESTLENTNQSNNNDSGNTSNNFDPILLWNIQQSSVHPGIILPIEQPPQQSQSSSSTEQHWYPVFLACGRECIIVDVYYYADFGQVVFHAHKRHNQAVPLASPILSAAEVTSTSSSSSTNNPRFLVLLTSDGLLSLRSSNCLGVSLRTIEVGPRPNDYFAVTSHPISTSKSSSVVAVAYSGECKAVAITPDTPQEHADRLLKLAMEALGTNGFPRTELAEAIHASFTVTAVASSSESNVMTSNKILLKQYLEAFLGLAEFESGTKTGWSMIVEEDGERTAMSSTEKQPTSVTLNQGSFGSVVTGTAGMPHHRRLVVGRESTVATTTTCNSSSPAMLLTATAMLCLVCSQLSSSSSLLPHVSTLASKSAQVCAEKLGVVVGKSHGISAPAIQVCEQVADKLLREASSKFSLLSGSSRHSHQASTDFIEAAIWLLRSCGQHERALDITYERLQQQQQQQQEDAAAVRGLWSQIKYESYTATHLSEIWSANREEGCRLVLSSPATQRLLEHNPRLGLSVFTALHPQNAEQWRNITLARENDPLSQNPQRTYDVLQLLKSINPAVPRDKDRTLQDDTDDGSLALPLDSGRALAVTFLRSAIGISKGRSADFEDLDTSALDADLEEHVANFHDELSFLLLEGIILERTEDEKQTGDTMLGKIYRSMLRELLKWPLANIRSEHFIEALPPAFLQEKALVLGRLGRHEDALRILYRDLKDLDLALEYCDDRHALQKQQHERLRLRYQKASLFPETEMMIDFHTKEEDNAYLPLIRVALSESENSDRGTATAIKVLALRRSAIDRAAALRLLPSEVPVSAVARPFLIPALVDSESQVRRMTVVSALLRSRYLRLKDKLIAAQLRAQANIHVVPQLRSLNLGEPMHSTKAFRARTSSSPSPTMPDVQIIKHFFPRHLVIQAKVTNVPYSSFPSSGSAALYATDSKPNILSNQIMLSDIVFVVAESSEEEAIQPLLQVPIPLLPPKMTGSAWCVLSASPNSMDSNTAQLTCELRYSIQSALDMAALPTSSTSVTNNAMLARTYVEELQDIEVNRW